MRILHPGIEDQGQARAVAPRLNRLHGKRVVLLDNNHFNVDRFLQILGERLETESGATVIHLKKPMANAAAPAEILEAALREGDAVINGIAD